MSATSRSRAVHISAMLILSAAVACGPKPEPRPAMEVTILHTNDIHGKFTETPATWKEGNPPIGGFENLSAYVNEERAGAGRVLLLDAGDFMTGNPICDYAYGGVRGGAMVELMNRLDYDAAALGNHEFDHGLRNLDSLLALAAFPILSANTYRPGGGLTTGESHRIFDLGGLRIGVIGVMTEDLYGVTAPAALLGTKVTPAAEAVRGVVRAIDPKTDLIIVVSHIGFDGDKALAREVDGVDVIVGGHSHTRLTKPEVENGVIIVQTGGHNRSVGRLRLTVDHDVVTSHDGTLIDLWPRDGAGDEVARLVAEWEGRIDRDYGQVIGRLATAWERASSDESNIGDWLADRLREHGGGDFAVINSGGIRKDMSAGPITRLDVLEILPFSNTVVTFKCSGAQLLDLVRTNAEAAVGDSKGILQIGGIRYAYLVDGDRVRVTDVTVGGKPVDAAATYTGVSIDYVVYGNAMRYLGFDPAEKEIEGTLISTVIMRAIEASPGAIDSRVDGRIVRLPARVAAGRAG
jgi:2',3'-cyclic-nucleotide 2'-phosphodiesterase (5'-nucleotidase family)